MKTLSIDQIAPGSTVAYPIARNGFFVSRGATLTLGMLDRLWRAGVTRVCVAD